MRFGGLVIDTLVCLTLAKWETVSGQFGGYLSAGAHMANPFQFLIADWQWVLVLAVLMIGLLVDGRRRRKIHTLEKAISHMSQGVCMFDSATRIILCNPQYLRMYNLSPTVVKPGCTLRRLIEHRRETGLLTADPAHNTARTS